MAKNQSSIVPAFLCKNKQDFLKKLKRVAPHVKRIQYDIMDNEFVKNKTVQPKEFRDLKTKVKIESQLMVKDPHNYLLDCCKMNSWMIIFHYESYKNENKIKSFINQIKAHKMKVGIAINPKTPAKKIKPFLKLVDLVLVMTVKPGFGGQKLIPSTLSKIKLIRKWNKTIDIEVDGGINSNTANSAFKAGANIFVAGNAIHKAKTIKQGIKKIKQQFK